MSFGGDDSNKSIADKTTERESKNTIATVQTGVGFSQAAVSANLTNNLKSQSNYRRVLIGPNGTNATVTSN